MKKLRTCTSLILGQKTKKYFVSMKVKKWQRGASADSTTFKAENHKHFNFRASGIDQPCKKPTTRKKCQPPNKIQFISSLSSPPLKTEEKTTKNPVGKETHVYKTISRHMTTRWPHWQFEQEAPFSIFWIGVGWGGVGRCFYSNSQCEAQLLWNSPFKCFW